jgi:hypothetical protein
VDILLAFQNITKDKYGEAVITKHGKMALSAHLVRHGQFSTEQVVTLGNISHPGVLLLAMTVTQSTELSKSLLSRQTSDTPISKPWTPSKPWTDLTDICYGHLRAQTSPNEALLRACIVGSSLSLYDRIYEQHISHLEVFLSS